MTEPVDPSTTPDVSESEWSPRMKPYGFSRTIHVSIDDELLFFEPIVIVEPQLRNLRIPAKTDGKGRFIYKQELDPEEKDWKPRPFFVEVRGRLCIVWSPQTGDGEPLKGERLPTTDEVLGHVEVHAQRIAAFADELAGAGAAVAPHPVAAIDRAIVKALALREELEAFVEHLCLLANGEKIRFTQPIRDRLAEIRGEWRAAARSVEEMILRAERAGLSIANLASFRRALEQER